MIELIKADDPNFTKLWNEMASNSYAFDALYGEKNLRYYEEYCAILEAKDFSFILAKDSKPLCGLKAFHCITKNGSSEISCFGLPLLYLQDTSMNFDDRHNIYRAIKSEISQILNVISKGGVLKYRDNLQGGVLSPIGKLLAEKGAVATSSFSQIIDLSMSYDDLHKELTKAYKWSVNWGKKNLITKIYNKDSITFENINQFRLLHIEAAQRETRSIESWKLQLEMICAGEAFCVFSYNDSDLMSAALFPHSSSTCFYGVSASRRNYFDRPLGHVVLWSAIVHAKEMGIKHFEMGEQIYSMTPKLLPSKKELGISFFKRAFGGSTHVFLDFSLNIKNQGTEETEALL